MMEKRTSSVCKREENRPVILSVNEPEQIPLRELNDNMEEATNPRSSFLVESPANDVFHSLSGIYAEILIVVTSASVFAEILPGSLPLFYFHDYLLLYLLGVGIMIFLVTQSIIFCRRISPKSEINADPPPISQKKAQEKNIFAINIFFKVGSAVSGSIVIITSLLEIISIFISSNYCLNTLSAVQPIIRIIFVLFHYIFLMSPKEILDTLGCFRNLALMHLFASNIVIWIRMLLWESGKDWGEIMHVKHNSSVIWDKNELNITMHSLESDINAEDINEHYPKHVVHYTSNCWWRVQKSEEVDITSVQYCLQNSTIGQIWERTDQFLFVFKTQYFILIACILYIIWYKCSYNNLKHNFLSNSNCQRDFCSRATKGFCLGSMIFITSCIASIMFFSVERKLNMSFGIIFCVIFGSSSISAILGLFEVKKMNSWKSAKDIHLITLFQSIGLFAVFVYGSCNIIANSLLQYKSSFLSAFEAISMVFQGTVQYLFIVQVSRKKIDASNANEKPGRQMVVFLILCNISLWMLECFIAWSHLRSQYMLTSEAVWPIAIRCVLPFVVFYRYHSIATLTKAWLKTYKPN